MTAQPPYPPQGPPPYGPPGGQPPYGPPGGQPPYGPPPGGPYYGQPSKPGSGMAIGALVCGILAILFSWTIVGGILLGLIAAILGFIAYSKAKKGQAGGTGMSLTGIILGLVGIALSIVLVVVGVGLFKKSGAGDYIDCINKAGDNTSEQQRCADEFQRHIEDQFDITITPFPTP